MLAPVGEALNGSGRTSAMNGLIAIGKGPAPITDLDSATFGAIRPSSCAATCVAKAASLFGPLLMNLRHICVSNSKTSKLLN